jgi:hypothetical protein
MDPNKLRKLVTLAGEHALLVLTGLRQPLVPTWVYLDGEDKTHIVGTPWHDDEEKEHAARHIRWLMRKDKAQAYSLVSEVWTAAAPPGWKPGEDLVRPADRPDRKEMVLAFATDGEQTKWGRWQIKRDWNERVIALEEQPFDGAQPESWLNKLLY